jgi:hypothetical protein
VTLVKDTDRMSELTHEIRIAYKLLLDAKRDKLRIADMVLALQDCTQTPPGPGTSPRITGIEFSAYMILENFSIFPSIHISLCYLLYPSLSLLFSSLSRSFTSLFLSLFRSQVSAPPPLHLLNSISVRLRRAI